MPILWFHTWNTNSVEPFFFFSNLQGLPGTVYVERCALSSPARIKTAKQAIKTSFQMQMDGAQGLGLVELLCACPTYWRKSPVDAVKWIESDMTKIYPLGCIKNKLVDGQG